MSAVDREEAHWFLRQAGKNVSSGPFFELLRAIEEDRCDIMARLNSSGIPLGSPLGQELLRIVRNGESRPSVFEEDLEPWREGELLVLGSPHKQCGIREYGAALNAQFEELGATVRGAHLQDLSLLRSARGDVLIHVEPSLLLPALDDAVKEASSNGARVVLCFHAFTDAIFRRLESLVSAMVVHRGYGVEHPKLHHIPLGCPIYEPTKSVQELRAQYGLPNETTVVTTFGFLVAWKRFPETAAEFLKQLESEPESRVFLQMLCSPHFVPYPEGERRLREIVGDSPMVQLQTVFLSQEELTERLYASDLGFVFHGENTGSVSAATKQFVAARCPLVVTSSNHAEDMLGAAKAPVGLKGFVRHVLDVVKKPEEIAKLKRASELEYRRLNMKKVAEQYLELFASLERA